MSVKSEMEKLEEIVSLASQPGNANYDSYMFGMANGLILALAIMKDEEPKYLEAPKEWENKELNK